MANNLERLTPDYNNLIKSWLAPVVEVLPEYPQSEELLPCAVIVKVGDVPGAVYENVEYTTIINYQITVIAKTIRERDLICDHVQKIMREHYWQRLNSSDIYEAGHPARNVAIYTTEQNNQIS